MQVIVFKIGHDSGHDSGPDCSPVCGQICGVASIANLMNRNRLAGMNGLELAHVV